MPVLQYGFMCNYALWPDYCPLDRICLANTISKTLAGRWCSSDGLGGRELPFEEVGPYCFHFYYLRCPPPRPYIDFRYYFHKQRQALFRCDSAPPRSANRGASGYLVVSSPISCKAALRVALVFTLMAPM